MKKILILLFMMFILTSCNVNSKIDVEEDNEIIEYVSGLPENNDINISDSRFKTILPKAGDEVYNFTVKHIGKIDSLKANTAHFLHDASGLNLYYIQTDDKELSFQISFRVPYEDESDAPHVFEHTILSGSKKYNSSNLFFDLNNKTFNTYVNAYTTNAVTSYPVSSMSEEQLLKMVDVYMSCMIEPNFLEDINIFKREGIRYELSNQKDAISIKGTVYSEDLGYMTSESRAIYEGIQKSLYKGTILANAIGRANTHIEELTYEKMIEIYNKYYKMSNAVAILYGNLDYNKFLNLLDNNYLSKITRDGNDYSKIYDIEMKADYIESINYIPAYRETESENNSVVTYAMDFYGKSAKDKIKIDIVNSLISDKNSYLNSILFENSINSVFTIGDTFTDGSAFDAVIFELSNCSDSDADVFKDSVEEALNQIIIDGVQTDIVNNKYKFLDFEKSILRNNTGIGIAVGKVIAADWAKSDNPYFLEYEEMSINELKEDTEQIFIKQYVNELLNAKRKSLITHTVMPGLAEEMEKNTEDYLKNLKKEMTRAEVLELIKETKDFNEKSKIQNRIINNDFYIPIDSLPDVNMPYNVDMANIGDIRSYTSYVNFDDVGRFCLIFDTSNVSQDEIFDLSLYKMLLKELPTDIYSRDDVNSLFSKYFYNFDVSIMYPDQSSAEFNYPMLYLSWDGLVNDYGKSLEFLLNVLSNTNYSYKDDLIDVILKNKEYYNLAKYDNLKLANLLTNSNIKQTAAYRFYAEGNEFYKYLNNIVDKLEKDDDYINTVVNKMKNIIDKVISKTHIATYIAASEENVFKVEEINREKLLTLKSNTITHNNYTLPYGEFKKVGGYINSKLQTSFLSANFKKEENFKGKYIPYIVAANDKFFIPNMRFINAAYSAGVSVDLSRYAINMYTYSDPNTEKTLKEYDNFATNLSAMDLTEDELNGYILKTYSMVCFPIGEIDKAEASFLNLLSGVDELKIVSIGREIKNANIDDKKDAAAEIKKILSNAVVSMIGNATDIKKIAKRFNKIYDFRK